MDGNEARPLVKFWTGILANMAEVKEEASLLGGKRTGRTGYGLII